MPTRKEHTVRATAEELRVKRARGETGSDSKRAAKMTVPDGSDPDDAIEPVRMDGSRRSFPCRAARRTHR